MLFIYKVIIYLDSYLWITIGQSHHPFMFMSTFIKHTQNTQNDTQRNKGTNICCKHTSCQPLYLMFHFSPQNNFMINEIPMLQTRKWKFRDTQPITFDEWWYKDSNPNGKSKSFKTLKVLHTHPSHPLYLRYHYLLSSLSSNPAELLPPQGLAVAVLASCI